MQHVKRTALLTTVLAIAAAGDESRGEVWLPAVIGDNMVLPRESEAALWGRARPGERVVARAEWGEGAEAVADERGRWRVALSTPGAGGPYSITVSGDTTVTLSNVLIGEVWLCSGQSNMEWPVRRADDADREIASAGFPSIRLFTAPNTPSLHPRIDGGGEWVECTPDTIGGFSAVGYFFGRTLHGELDVPIGLISADWGGTVVEAWMSEAALSSFPEFESSLETARILRDPNRRGEYVNKRTGAWWDRLDELGPDAPGAGWTSAGYGDGHWKTMRLPATWESQGLEGFDGIVRFRRLIDLPTAWDGRAAFLELGPVDDRDDAWVNGVRVGGMRQAGRWNVPRRYEVPAGVLHPGSNVIAVRVLDTGGAGGINGRPGQMVLTPAGDDGPEPVFLAGEWRYLAGTPASSLPAMPTSGVGRNTPTALYNGMISPLIPFSLRGVIWYQGESNRDRPAQYGRLFPAMIEQWRGDWGRGDFPFYFVQIAPFRYRDDAGQVAELREAQLMTLDTANTGMVVTTDIGNPTDIHPRNKQEVGRRLALWALAGTYGRAEVVPSGPIYRSMTIEGDSIRVSFDHVGGGLVGRGETLTHFQIAGRNRQFHDARAVVDGETVVVSSQDVPDPVAVRFGWEAAPEPNLFNAAALPASPFRTDDWAR